MLSNLSINHAAQKDSDFSFFYSYSKSTKTTEATGKVFKSLAITDQNQHFCRQEPVSLVSFTTTYMLRSTLT